MEPFLYLTEPRGYKSSDDLVVSYLAVHRVRSKLAAAASLIKFRALHQKKMLCKLAGCTLNVQPANLHK